MGRFQRALAVIFVILPLILVVSCDAHHYFYRPTQVVYADPADQGLRYEEVFLDSLDGTRLHGWFVHAEGPARATLIHFHGNNKNISGHLRYVDWLPRHGFNVFLFDYRGYGQSAGKPAPEGLTDDGVVAIRHVQARRDVDPRRLLVFAQSLGGSYALAALARERRGVCAAVVEGAFSSHRAIAVDQMASDDVPRPLKSAIADLLFDTRHDADPLIGQLGDLPIMLIHGSADDVVPIAHGDRLATLLPQGSVYWRIDGDRHLETFMPGREKNRERLLGFFAQSLANCSARSPGGS